MKPDGLRNMLYGLLGLVEESRTTDGHLVEQRRYYANGNLKERINYTPTSVITDIYNKSSGKLTSTICKDVITGEEKKLDWRKKY